MLRLASLLIFFSLTTSFYASDFDHCHQEVKKSYKFSQNRHYYKTPYGWLVFSNKHLDGFLRSEPLLGLYLFKDKTDKQVIKVLNRYPKDVAAISPASMKRNRIMNEGLGIDRLALLKEKSFQGAGIFGACCTLRGINSGLGVVTSDYILHFLRDKKRFATAGMRVSEIDGKLIVTAVNPFFAYNPFKKGDEILYFDGYKYSLETLTRKILFSSVGSKHYFRIKRKGSMVKVNTIFKERLGGAILADTYLEHYGFQFDTNLEVVSVRKESVVGKLALLPGDILKAINNIQMKSDSDIRAFLNRGIKTEKMRLLIERDGLQFNIYLPSNIMLTL